MTITKKFSRCLVYFVLLFSIFLPGLTASAQIVDQKELPRNTYIGLSIGVNDYGLGLIGESPIGYKISLFGNVGLGGWGYKFGGGIIYYPRQAPFGPGFGLGYAYASGIESFETELEVEPNDQKELVELKLYGISTINLTYSHSWAFWRSGKFSIVTGYAIKLPGNTYDVITDGIELTSDTKTFLKLMQPGGFTLGLRLMFGFN